MRLPGFPATLGGLEIHAARLRSNVRRLMQRDLITISALLVGILLVLFFPFVTGQETLMNSSQDVSSIYPYGALGAQDVYVQKIIDAGAPGWFVDPMWVVEQRQDFSEHNPPLWNPYIAYGTPLAADPQSQPYYPLTLPVILSPNPVMCSWWVLARLFLAGFLAFLWLRFFVPFPAGAAGSIAFMLTGYFILFYDLPHLSVEVLLPLGFYASEFLFRRRDVLAVGLFGLTVLLIMLGGMPESQVLVLSFTYAYWMFRIIVAGEGLVTSVRLAFKFVAGSVIGLASAMAFLLPLVQFIPLSSNIHAPGTGLQADPVSAAIIAYFLPLIFGPVRNSILHDFSGDIGIHGYLGVVAPLFAIIASACALRAALLKRIGVQEQLVFFFLGSTAFLILKQYGSPLVNWLGRLPIFDMIVYWKYDQPLIAWCIAALCAFGVARAMEIANRKIVAAISVLALAFITAVFLHFHHLIQTRAVHVDYFYGSLLLALVLVIAVAATTVFPRLSSFPRLRFGLRCNTGLVLAALVAVDLSLNYVVPVFYFASAEPRANVTALSGGPYIKFLQKGTAVSQARVYGEGGFLYPNWSEAFQLSDVRGLAGLFYDKYLPFVRAFFPSIAAGELADRFTGVESLPVQNSLGRRWLALSSVGYIITGDTRFDQMPAYFERVYNADAYIYRVKKILPRASLFYHVVTAADDPAALEVLTSPRMDVFSTATLTGSSEAVKSAVLALAVNGSHEKGGTAKITSYASQRVEVSTITVRPAVLMLNDSDFPGWRIYIDGRSAPIMTADYWFRGVLIRPGKHLVVFRYEPEPFYVGMLVSCIGLIALIALLLSGWVTDRFGLRLGLGAKR